MKRKRIIILIAIVIVLGIGATYFIWNKTNDELTDNEKIEKEIKEKALFVDGKQSVQVEDYTLTLEEYYYDSETYEGKVLFSLMQDGKNGEEIVCNEGHEHARYTFYFGTDIMEDSYYVGLVTKPTPGLSFVTGKGKQKLYYKDNKKYIYYEFYLISLSGEFDGKLALKDYRTDSPPVNHSSEGLGVFKLLDTVEWEKFTSENSDNVIRIADNEVEINDGMETDIKDFTMVMKNGKKYSLVNEDFKELTYENKKKENVTRLRFNSNIDVEKIDYIEWEGIKYNK